MATHAEVLAVADGALDGAALLVSVRGTDGGTVQDVLRQSGASVRSFIPVGSHAAPYRFGMDSAGNARP